MKDGKVSEVGTYSELLSHNGAFAELIKTYLTDENGDDEDEDDEEGKRNDSQITQLKSYSSWSFCNGYHRQTMNSKNYHDRVSCLKIFNGSNLCKPYFKAKGD